MSSGGIREKETETSSFVKSRKFGDEPSACQFLKVLPHVRVIKSRTKVKIAARMGSFCADGCQMMRADLVLKG